MGLLLYPVGVCDRRTFLEDLYVFMADQNLGSVKSNDLESVYHFRGLGIRVESCSLARDTARECLYRKFGCLASAIFYLHRHQIKYKDLKPSNIVFCPPGYGGLRLIDFRTSTDSLDRSSSESNNAEQGFQKYFPPEVEALEGDGRPADIFMLGCIFFEMCWSICIIDQTMYDLAKRADRLGGSYHANLSTMRELCLPIQLAPAASDQRHASIVYLIALICRMMAPDPKLRPTAFQIRSWLIFFERFREKRTEGYRVTISVALNIPRERPWE